MYSTTIGICEMPTLIFLFHFINNTGSTLLISDVVREEVENINCRELGDVIENISAQLRKAQKMIATKVEFNLKSLMQEYDFSSLLITKTDQVEFIKYERIT